MISQHHISGALLLAVRQTELQRGTLLAHHGRHPAALRPTLRRLHKITDRHARKLAARYREHVAVYFQHVTGDPAGFRRLDGNWYITAADEFKHAA